MDSCLDRKVVKRKGGKLLEFYCILYCTEKKGVGRREDTINHWLIIETVCYHYDMAFTGLRSWCGLSKCWSPFVWTDAPHHQEFTDSKRLVLVMFPAVIYTVFKHSVTLRRCYVPRYNCVSSKVRWDRGDWGFCFLHNNRPMSSITPFVLQWSPLMQD